MATSEHLQCDGAAPGDRAGVRGRARDATRHGRAEALGIGEHGEPWAICFYLKTQGRKRGYLESRQIDVEDRLTLEQAVLAAYEKRKARETKR